MKRFRFKLQPVLGVAHTREGLARQALAAALERERRERLALDRITSTYDAGCLRLAGLQQEREMSALEMASFGLYLRRLAGERDRQGIVLSRATQAVAARRDAVIEQRKKVRVLERLRDRRHGEYARLCLAEEQKYLDEVGGRCRRLPGEGE